MFHILIIKNESLCLNFAIWTGGDGNRLSHFSYNEQGGAVEMPALVR